MGSQTRAIGGRSQRDDLEQLQEELRDVRHQRQSLPLENAELAAQATRLEAEVRALQQARDGLQAERKKPRPCLPEQLLTPFCATPSQRTASGRMRFALKQVGRSLPVQGLLLLLSGAFFRHSPAVAALSLGSILVWFMLLSGLSPVLEDEDECLAWSFDDEGFGQIAAGKKSERIRYSEVRKVEVKQGWFRRLWNSSFIRVTWEPGTLSSVGKRTDAGNRVADIRLHEDPQRLAEWLLERTQEGRGEAPGGQHGS
jgi:hypothetical protein